ncbi:MAG: 50S ribosomal protein L18 [Candidatus Pacebacteria bacterium GW2011_GWF2_38_9]|nr:MAG: 50S ribosomal protein L18, large subunit ribosomal protein L18 [candidate division TM6 bacterium GW2011_GWF2_28_16]KKQ08255.1 MAG: 50S ribosomal protein L18 [Candidatus Pacebacteria bacterium GW2011_GWF1_36_5]KKQ88573.1 MAG: 50S ribosomal protein L18 [Candidatus Pacebacteria bacterium GW2011_GWF2_38_9]MBU1033546.1 50S ribosomal protein L18 [Patescibacteria group bacterium]HAZ73520.1 50S ribosomal protein L18 [Candidatus Paceibacterota bacterium]
MSDIKLLNKNRIKRQKRIRTKIVGTTLRPRLTVFRSNEHISLQVIDDSIAKTLVSADDKSKDKKVKGTKTERAIATSKVLLELLKKNKIENLVFDRSYYKYHGRIKAVAETLREGGIKL